MSKAGVLQVTFYSLTKKRIQAILYVKIVGGRRVLDCLVAFIRVQIYSSFIILFCIMHVIVVCRSIVGILTK